MMASSITLEVKSQSKVNSQSLHLTSAILSATMTTAMIHSVYFWYETRESSTSWSLPRIALVRFYVILPLPDNALDPQNLQCLQLFTLSLLTFIFPPLFLLSLLSSSS